jgi:hypothetical protein
MTTPPQTRCCVLCGETFVRPLDEQGKIAGLFCFQCLLAMRAGKVSTRPQPYREPLIKKGAD